MKSKEIFYLEYKELCQNTRILESENYIQHGKTTVLLHSVAVAYYSYSLALLLGIKISEKELIRGALLHDYFLYDWHKKEDHRPLHGFHHSHTALKNAKKHVVLTEIEMDIIEKHMFPLTPNPPKFKESILVCLVDKACSAYEVFIMRTYPKLKEKILKKSY